MFVTSTGVVSRKYRAKDTGGSWRFGKRWNLLVHFTDPKTLQRKTRYIKCTESQYNRLMVGDMVGLQRDTAWWALWASWRIAG